MFNKVKESVRTEAGLISAIVVGVFTYLAGQIEQWQGTIMIPVLCGICTFLVSRAYFNEGVEEGVRLMEKSDD